MDKEKRKVSKLWWILPIIFGIIGGIIAWVFIRNKNPDQAKDMLMVGVALTFIIASMYALGVFV